MDELAKTEARNYLSAAGFFVIAAYYLLLLFRYAELLFNDAETVLDPAIPLAFGFGLLISGILLLVLRNRDMIALLFIMLSFYFIANVFAAGYVGVFLTLCFNGLLLLTILVTITGKDKAKWMIVILPLLMLITPLIDIFAGARPSPAAYILFTAIAVISLYFAFCCACERINLPGRKLLTADEQTDFKASGSALGYLLFAATVGAYVVYYIVGESMLSLETLHTVNVVAAFLLILVGILLLTIGKMRFTPVMFIAAGLTELLAMYSAGSMFIGTGILFIIIGLFAMLRKESRILPGIMFVVYGCADFFTAYAGGNTPIVSIILNAIPCLIAIYLAFVVYSQKKLPKF